MKSQRIAFLGSDGSGKTALLMHTKKQLEEQGKSVAVVGMGWKNFENPILKIISKIHMRKKATEKEAGKVDKERLARFKSRSWGFYSLYYLELWTRYLRVLFSRKDVVLMDRYFYEELMSMQGFKQKFFKALTPKPDICFALKAPLKTILEREHYASPKVFNGFYERLENLSKLRPMTFIDSSESIEKTYKKMEQYLKGKNRMIYEIFGLSKSGKSTLKEKLSKEGYEVVRVGDISTPLKFAYFLKHLAIHPLNTGYLFYKLNTNHLKVKDLPKSKYAKVFLMRNSYLLGALSKYERIKNKSGVVFTDELSFQSIFMIFTRNSSEKEIKNVIKRIPKSDFLLVTERDKKKRHESYKVPHPTIPNATIMPASWLHPKFAEAWMGKMEYNFDIIKGFIQETYKRDEQSLGHIDLAKLYKDDPRNLKGDPMNPPKVFSLGKKSAT